MPEFSYRARDASGQLQTGMKSAANMDALGQALLNDGMTPLEIKPAVAKKTVNMASAPFAFLLQRVTLQELTIFSRQMQLLYAANVPVMAALQQLAINTRSRALSQALHRMREHLASGLSLSAAMQKYPHIFTPLMISLVQVGEKTGKLSETFGNLHHYLQFEAENLKKIKSSFRYPLFTFISVLVAILSINTLVIPTFAHLYQNLGVNLPWETRVLIFSSQLTTKYGFYCLVCAIALFVYLYRGTKKGALRYRWHQFLLKVPIFNALLKRLLLIRLTQSLAIMLNSGFTITQSLSFVKNVLQNAVIQAQIQRMQEALLQGLPFSQAITNISLFTPLEAQILSVGETNGELSPALEYIASFQTQEIEFEIKRINDVVGPLLIAILSGLILIVALGVYLPIWNMINLVHG